MATASPESEQAVSQMVANLTIAARLRAQGAPWSQVEETVGRAPGSCRRWPSRHPEEWQVAMIAAIEELLPTLESEAIHAARADLRAEDGTTRGRACATILRHCRELRGTRMKLEVSGPDGGPIEVVWDEAKPNGHNHDEPEE